MGKTLAFNQPTARLLHLPMEMFFYTQDLPAGYLVSNQGRVKSCERVFIKSDGRRKTVRERILKQQVNQNGYPTITLRSVGGKNLVFRVHQLVAKAFIIENHHLPIINHKDGNKLNNHSSNLEWCNHSQNLKHAYDNNLRSHNTRNAVAAAALKRSQR